ncbi:MAG: phosphoserine phosphatase, partial [Clostridia bacterium]|nr:phosphoserine phosphatase [Clostridia bacterium]
LAIFDFDGTLFPKDTLPFLLEQWKELKYSKAKYYKTYSSVILLYIQYKLGINFKLTREEMRLAGFKKFNIIFKGMTTEEVNKFFYEASNVIKYLLNKNVLSEVEKCRSEGFHLVLLSGAHLSLLKYIGEYLKFDTVIGSELKYSNNIFDPDKDIEVISGKMKQKKIQAYFKAQPIAWNLSRAYADSYSDIPLFELIGQPITVNPDNKLKEIAIEKNWKIIY